MNSELTREQIIGLKDALLGYHIPPCTQEQWRYVCDLALSALTARSEGFREGVEAAARICDAEQEKQTDYDDGEKTISCEVAKICATAIRALIPPSPNDGGERG